ncbi:MAG: glycosyltransferase family 39 protein [candidate division WOR-3 bacterium]
MKTRIIILIILILGISVRLIGINFGLPYATQARPDELVIIRYALPFGTGDLNPHFFHYPSLFLYLSFILFAIYFLFGKLFGLYLDANDFAASVLLNPAPLILMLRIFSALFGTFTVYLTYLIGKAKDETTGLLSAILLALAYLHVQQSHFGTTDVTMVGFGLLALLFAQRVFTQGKITDYIKSGLFAGMAGSTKYNGALFLIPLIAAFLLRLKQEPLNTSGRKIIIGIVTALLSFFFFSPFILLDFTTFRTQFSKETSHLLYGATIELGRGWVNFITVALNHGLGLPLLVFAFLTIVYFIIKCPRYTTFLISFPLMYYLLMGAGKAVYVRHALPIVPFLCIISAIGISELFARFKGINQIIVISVVILLLLANSLPNLFGYLTTITKKDTRSLATEWIDRNIPANSTIGWVGSAWSVPNLPFSAQEVAARYSQFRIGFSLPEKIITRMKAKVKTTGYRILRYDEEKGDTDTFRFFRIDQIKPRDITYLVVTSYPALPFGEVPKAIATLTADTINFIFLTQFNPFRCDNPRLIMDKQDATYLPFANFPCVIRPGPLIKIYRIKKVSSEIK